MFLICYVVISTDRHKVILNKSIDDVSEMNVNSTSPKNSVTATTKQQSVTIFMANRFFEDDISAYHLMDMCSANVRSYCSISSNKEDFDKASAVVFHAANYRSPENQNNGKSTDQVAKDIDYYFTHRKRSVPYVIWTMESPTNEQNFPQPPHFINWTMSYDKASDSVYSYGKLFPLDNSDYDSQKIWEMKKPSKTGADIAWMVSNCGSANKRMEIVKKMQSMGMKIDIYGKCGVVPPNCSKAAQDRNCEKELISPYKFFFTLENSNCAEYVSEKFWFTLKHRFTVPIVLGKKTYVEAGIPESSFIALDDFQNLNEFSDFIKSTSQNKTRYLEFHQWRKNFEVGVIWDHGDELQGFCKLCQKIRAGDHLTEKWYDVLLGKWHSSKQCDNSVGLRFLS